MATLEIGQQLGHYRLLKLLGRGGMGGVYMAENLRTQRTVALKAVTAAHLHDAAEQEAFNKRFLREARIGEGLVHPNIVRVYDSGQDGPWLFLVMEVVTGGNLRHQITPKGYHPHDQALAVVQRIGMALDYAHARGVIHRDIKPENILVDQAGLIKLVDFGISKTLEDTLITTPGFTVGTPEYMSPEQLLGKPQDARTDLFAFGILTHEMLTGIRPFRGDKPDLVFRRVIHGDFELAHFQNPDQDRCWTRAMSRILAPEPADRFDTAWNFLAALAEGYTQPGATKRAPDSNLATAGGAAETIKLTIRDTPPKRRG